jgi:hypothetical protein
MSAPEQVDSRTTHWRACAGKGLPTRLEPGDRSIHLPHVIPRGRDAGSNTGAPRASPLVVVPFSAPVPLSPSTGRVLCFLVDAIERFGD